MPVRFLFHQGAIMLESESVDGLLVRKAWSVDATAYPEAWETFCLGQSLKLPNIGEDDALRACIVPNDVVLSYLDGLPQ